MRREILKLATMKIRIIQNNHNRHFYLLLRGFLYKNQVLFDQNCSKRTGDGQKNEIIWHARSGTTSAMLCRYLNQGRQAGVKDSKQVVDRRGVKRFLSS
jgi:hypothetical protein